MGSYSYSVVEHTHKPDVIEAVQFDGTDVCAKALYEAGWFDNIDLGLDRENRGPLRLGLVNTRNGQVKVFPGDWVVKQADGEKYGIHPQVLAERYDANGEVDTVEIEHDEDAPDPWADGTRPTAEVPGDVNPPAPLDGIIRDETGAPVVNVPAPEPDDDDEEEDEEEDEDDELGGES